MWERPETETLDESAAALHEFYQSLRAAEFTQHQCWHIVLGKVDCERKECHGTGS